MTTAGIHDDAGAFPGFDEALARFAAVELHHEVVQVGDFFEQSGHVGFHFFEQRAAVHDLAARGAHYFTEIDDGGGEGGDAGGGPAGWQHARIDHARGRGDQRPCVEVEHRLRIGLVAGRGIVTAEYEDVPDTERGGQASLF